MVMDGVSGRPVFKPGTVGGHGPVEWRWCDRVDESGELRPVHRGLTEELETASGWRLKRDNVRHLAEMPVRQLTMGSRSWYSGRGADSPGSASSSSMSLSSGAFPSSGRKETMHTFSVDVLSATSMTDAFLS